MRVLSYVKIKSPVSCRDSIAILNWQARSCHCNWSPLYSANFHLDKGSFYWPVILLANFLFNDPLSGIIGEEATTCGSIQFNGTAQNSHAWVERTELKTSWNNDGGCEWFSFWIPRGDCISIRRGEIDRLTMGQMLCAPLFLVEQNSWQFYLGWLFVGAVENTKDS